MSILKREVSSGSINAEALFAAPPGGWEECKAPGPDVKLWIDWERGIDMELGEMLAQRIAIYIRPASGASPG
jgi:hypothetical protein